VHCLTWVIPRMYWRHSWGNKRYKRSRCLSYICSQLCAVFSPPEHSAYNNVPLALTGRGVAFSHRMFWCVSYDSDNK
jgi:hypothetical protein